MDYVVRNYTRVVDKSEEKQILYFPIEVPANVEKIEVSYNYDRFVYNQKMNIKQKIETNIIDLGMIGVNGAFRGASGSNKLSFEISECYATPGYIPGNIEKGIWHIVLGAYKVSEHNCVVDIIVKYTFKKLQLLKGDLHIHSTVSDGEYKVTDVINISKNMRLDYIFLSDHNNYYQNMFITPDSDITVIPAMELTNYKGHCNFLGLETPPKNIFYNTKEELVDILEEVHKSGALISINHPFDDCSWDMGFDVYYDLIEIQNGFFDENIDMKTINFWHENLCSGKKMPIVGGSDNHGIRLGESIGSPCTCVYSMSRGKEDILKAIKNGNSFVTSFRDQVEVYANVNQYILGETVPRSIKDKLNIVVNNLKAGDVIKVISNIDEQKFNVLENCLEMKLDIESKNVLFYRIEIWRKFFNNLDVLSCITNPIYFEQDTTIDYDKIENVHIVYKTHLDIGFTDLSSNVLKNYVESFIPKAINLAKELNTDNEKVFVWSVGSFLVDYFLKNATEENKESMREAIRRGDICWHGLPFTTHSELMNSELFEYGVEISKKLDAEFGFKTVAAKMTDVPGHTRGIIKHLSNNGIKYLHLGINDASTMPSVPKTFVWKDSENNSIIVDYCTGYGGLHHVEGSSTVMSFAHSGDNLGPPSKEEILHNIEVLKAKFPNAKVKASNLNEYGKELEKFRDNLPIVTKEIGDMWIHGVMSDPFKTGLLKEFLAVYNENKEKISKSDREIILNNALIVCEHTWGLDFKKYLADYKNWLKADFLKAREIDLLSDDYSIKEYECCLEFAKEEFAKQVKYLEWNERTYSHFEKSHEEQRNYLYNIINNCSAETKDIFKDVYENYKTLILKEEFNSYEVVNEKVFEIDNYKIEVGNTKLMVNNYNLGNFSYELLGTETFERYKREFSYDMEKNYDWAMPDYYKCGYELLYDGKENVSFEANSIEVRKKDNCLILHLVFDNSGTKDFGCPRNVYVKYEFLAGKVNIELNILDKDANRTPEALWFSMFSNEKFDYIAYKKLDENIVYDDVIHNGNINYHCVDSITLNNITVTPKNSPLVSIFEKRLYDFNQTFGDSTKGVHFNIYNNLWNTNFKMWYEEDIKTSFEVVFN